MKATLFFKCWSAIKGMFVVTAPRDPLARLCTVEVSKTPSEQTIAMLCKQIHADSGRVFRYKSTYTAESGRMYATFTPILSVTTDIDV